MKDRNMMPRTRTRTDTLPITFETRGEKRRLSPKTSARACAVWCGVMQLMRGFFEVCLLIICHVFVVFFLCILLWASAPCFFLHAHAFSGRDMQV